MLNTHTDVSTEMYQLELNYVRDCDYELTG